MNSDRATAWRELLREEGQIWIAALRTLAAILLAIGIAFRLGLDSPASAGVTVLIVSLQHSGMGLEKSFYRLIGTLVGALAALMFLALFAQQRDLFMFALIAWIGLCVAGSRWLRNFQAYGFVLAGYTAYIIGYPAYEHADAAFEIAVDRVSVVVLGILCGGLFSSVIFPRSSTPQLVRAVRKSFVDFSGFIEQAIARHVDRGFLQKAQQGFAQDVITLEEVRSASFFENPASRIRSQRLRRFNGEFMTASTTLHAVHRLREDLAERGYADVLAALRPLDRTFLRALQTGSGEVPGSAAAAAPVAVQLAALAAGWDSHATLSQRRLPANTADGRRIELDSALVMLHQLAIETRDYTETFASLDAPRSSRERTHAPGLVSHADGLMALIAGLRAMLTLAAVSAFWIYSGWADGFPAALLAAVACALFVNAPVPVRAAGQMLKGFVLGFAASFICLSFVLPRLEGFELLCAGLGPFLLIGTLLMARPATAGIGTGYGLMLLVALGLTNTMHYDVIELLNGGLAQLLGLGAAMLAFALILPAGHPWRAQRLRRMLAREITLTRSGRITGLRHRFESHVRDLMLQLGTLYGPDAAARLRDSAYGVRVLETGMAMISLREIVAAPALHSYAPNIEQCLDTVADAFVRANAESLHQACVNLAGLRAYIDADATAGAMPLLIRTRADLRVLQLALAEHAGLVRERESARRIHPEPLAHAP
ncbi:MAG: FUSC family protein [Stenotrophobium sp.]